jgi:hypothetical protein
VLLPVAMDDSRGRETADALALISSDARRLLFSEFILTLNLAVAWATAKRFVRGREINVGAILYAIGLVLEKVPGSRSICRLGDYTLYVDECGGIAGQLQNEPHINIRRDDFGETLLPFIDLARTVSAVRAQPLYNVWSAVSRAFNEPREARVVLIAGLGRLLLYQASLETVIGSPDPSMPDLQQHLGATALTPIAEGKYIAVIDTMNAVYRV